jgi:raffinose/stachyose/melibiose transport system permease protein
MGGETMAEYLMETKRKARKRLSVKPGKVIVYLVLLFWLVLTIYPLIFTFISSLKSQNDLFSNIFGLPKKIMYKNYYDLFFVQKIQNNILHSLFISCTTILIQIVICSMVAFVLSRFKFKFSNALLIFFMAGILIPQQSVLIPITLMAKAFNGFNNYLFMIVIYVAFGVPNFVFITTGFMKSLPREVEEAAVIDGCSMAKIFWTMILPLSLPAIASAAILSFFGAWNDLILALILLKDNTMQTISLGLVSFTNEQFSNYTGQFAAVIVSIIPTLVLYFILQKQIMKGMTAGAVKG